MTPELFALTREYMIETLKKHIALGLDTQKSICLRQEKMLLFLEKLNKEASLFGEMVVLEHPRYIEQYKSKEKQLYIDKILSPLLKNLNYMENNRRIRRN